MIPKAVYPGTFDPLTLGHLDVIERAATMFDTLVLGVANSTPKKTLFSTEERIELARQATAHLGNVEIDSFDGLLVDFAHAKEIRLLVRGLRAFSDFEFEFQMALTNRKMAPDIETIFLMPKEEYSYISSSMVRQITELGGNTAEFVPEAVYEALKAKFSQ